MFSRAGLLFLTLAVLGSGCGLRLSEKAPEPSSVGINGDYGCVGRIAEQVNLYINDKLSENDINSFTRCLQKSFISFAQLMHGRESDTYRPDELRQFIQDNFLRNKVISDDLLKEFMVIKQVFVGGGLDRVTREDLKSAISILEDIRLEALRMKPHIKVLNKELLQETLKKQSPVGLGSRLRLAQEALNLSIATLTSRLVRNQRPYSFANLSRFMTEFRTFTGWQQQFQNSKDVAHWVEFVKVFKVMTVSTGEESIAASEWAPLLRSFSRWYMVNLQFDVGVKERNVFHGAGFENVNYLADEVFRLAEEAIRAQPDQLIHFKQIDRMVAAVKNLDWLEPQIRVESVNKISRVLLNRIFGSMSLKPCDRFEGGLSEFNLSNIESEFYRWSRIQKNLIIKFNEGVDAGNEVLEFDGKSTPSIAPPVNLRRLMKEMKINPSTDWNEFLQVEKRRPLYGRGVARVVLVPQSELVVHGVRHDFDGLSYINVMRSLGDLLFKGYSDHPTPLTWDSSITEDQLQEFYEDIRDLGIDLKKVDDRNRKAGRRAFLEGNLFTYAADGVQSDLSNRSLIKMSEVVELLGFLYSGGEISGGLYDDLAKLCEKGELDRFGKEKLKRSCVKEKLAGVVHARMENVPGLRVYLDGLSQEKREEYAQILLDTAFSPRFSNSEWLENSELSTIAVLIQYQEAVLTRYDADLSGDLDESEVEVAFLTFEALIDKVAESLDLGQLSNWKKRSALKYIVANKEIPTSWSASFDLTLREWTTWGFGIHADRLELAQVFRAIVQRLLGNNDAPSNVEPRVCRSTAHTLRDSRN